MGTCLVCFYPFKNKLLNVLFKKNKKEKKKSLKLQKKKEKRTEAQESDQAFYTSFQNLTIFI